MKGMLSIDDLRGIIYSKRFTPAQVSREMGWNENTLSTKLNKNNLRLSELEKICKIIGCELEIKLK